MTTRPTPSLPASLVIPETVQGGLATEAASLQSGEAHCIDEHGLERPRW